MSSENNVTASPVIAILHAEVTKVHLLGSKINCLSLHSCCKAPGKAPNLQLQTQQGLSSRAEHNNTMTSRSIRSQLHMSCECVLWASSSRELLLTSLWRSSKESTALIYGLQAKRNANILELYCIINYSTR